MSEEMSQSSVANRSVTDREFLRLTSRPCYETGPSLKLVDLFCGCGALTLGLTEAARRLGWGTEVSLAVDNDPVAAAVFAANFPGAHVIDDAVDRLFNGAFGRPATKRERDLTDLVDGTDILVAGPPCQGHSSLNNHTRMDDPRNKLYGRVVRAAEILQPRVIVIENVPGVLRDRGAIMQAAAQQFADLGYEFDEGTVSVERVGVPQRRRRHLLVASRERSIDGALEGLGDPELKSRDLRWAIGDLARTDSESDFDRPGRLSAENQRRIKRLFAKGEYDLPNPQRPPCHRNDTHTYKSMYGRLRWEEPAQTITTGFGSPGQGRYIHPSQPRTITPHEAARLQTIPDFFSFDSTTSRCAWARMIGNAVPPLLSLKLGLALIPSILSTSKVRAEYAEAA